MRFGPNRIAINTNEGLQKIYGTSAHTQKSRKFYGVFGEVFHGDSSLTTIDHQRHVRKKKAVSTALADANVKKMEELILKNVRVLLSRIGERRNEKTGQTFPASTEFWSDPKNMTTWCDYFSFDIMGDICFQGSFEMLSKPDNRYILDVLPLGVNGLNMTGHMPWIIKLPIGKLLFSGLQKDMEKYAQFAQDMSDKRLARESEGNVPYTDVYSFLLAANKDNKDESRPLFTPEDLVGESSLLITGGSDTTATAIQSTIFYLCHNLEKLTKAQKEIRPLFSQVEDIRAGPLLHSCKYIRACIDEAMRMSPGVPGLNPREVLQGGTMIEGIYFPEGTDLGTCHYAIHHNEGYYPDSFSYKPERWIAGSAPGITEDSVALCHSALCPFSLGSRGCVGKSVAYKEMMVVIGRMLWMYEMRLAEGSHNGEGDPSLDPETGRHRQHELQMKDMFVSKSDGPMVQYKLRSIQ